ncbi:MAG: hypothetical protein ACOYMD_15270, partial [Paludibacter sp.]
MKKILSYTIVLSLFSIVINAQISSSLNRIADDLSFVRVSKTNSHYFELSNGSSFIPVGPNICFPRYIIDEDSVFVNLETMFKNLSQNHGNYARIWLSHKFYEVENQKQGIYSDVQAKRIDRAVALATKYHIRLKLCFEHFRVLYDNEKRFKGSVYFDKKIYDIKNGGSFATIEDFFNTEKGREVYLNRVCFIVNRYKNNPTIFAWELWNEFNAIELPDKNKSDIDWTSDMLNRIHKLDNNHMVIQSLGSFHSISEREIYRSINSIPNNDYANIHRYLNQTDELDVCRGPMDILASDAVKELLSYGYNKPCMLGEAGAVEANYAGASKLYLVDTLGILHHDLLFAPFFAGSAGSGQSWHWMEYIDRNNLWFQFGRFNEAIKGINPLVENFQPSEFLIPECRAYTLTGKKTTLVWCRDAGSNWQTELIEN